ncbi:hypothetical protein T5B8_02065 [Salinisphaera sp. T5B8]|uniref:DUF924 family protein n=1 Tax=Salinisphaera sp. T5B8 TaxID=1304154 RepID=UPI0033428B18
MSHHGVETPDTTVSPGSVIDFWFDTLAPRDWFRKSAALDRRIAQQFGATLTAAARGELAHWRATPLGRLAEILVLDQFSRNIHRDSPRAFENDERALNCAREAIANGDDTMLTPQQRAFVYMPFMHSETLADHERALALYQALGLAGHLKSEREHYAIIERFGRYPHRNSLLGRTSTPAEAAFLREPGSSF